ncbi:Na+/H+ antiporter [bacterium CPR1]|nr:Na+/H+ antiporter [bacterium CPR1]
MHTPAELTLLLPLMLAAIIVAFVGNWLRLPYAISLVVAGLLMTPLQLTGGATLDPGLLVTVLLPPLLFESALNLRLTSLQANWRPLTIYAVLGTILSSLLVGFLSSTLLTLPLASALVFGALISSTDPISVVAVFKQCKVGQRLALLVEGESLFNDGVSVVLFSVLLAAATSASATIAPGHVLVRFVFVILGGAGVGVAVGLLASRLTREFDDPPLEITLTCLVAWGAFLLAESFHVSGVIATVTAGLTVANYGMATGMSPGTRLSVHSFWEFAAFLANSLVFLLLGIQETLVNFWGDLGGIAVAFLLVLLGRAAAVYGLAPVVNGLGAQIPPSWLHIMVWSGLRGALAVALVSGLPPDFPGAQRLIHLTYGVVLFSLLLQGTTMSWLLRKLGITSAPERLQDYRRLSSQARAARAALKMVESRQSQGLPRPIAEETSRHYRAKLEALEQELSGLEVTHRELFDEQLLETRKLALTAEKASLLEDQRAGLLEEEDMLELFVELDRELTGLHQATAAPPLEDSGKSPDAHAAEPAVARSSDATEPR